MSDIFEEVEEGLRQDKATELWKRFGPLVWAIGLLIIGAVAYNEWAKSQQTKADRANILAFEEARASLTESDYANAQTAFQALVDKDTKISPLAAHLLAQAYYEGSGDAATAASVLESVAASDKNGPIERLALLKAAYLQSDQMSLAELESFLGELPRENTSLGVLALELIAAKALKEGDLERARQEFSYLRFAPNAPPGVLQRAEVAISVIPVPEASEVAVEETQAEDQDPTPASTEGTAETVIEGEAEQ